MAQTGYTPLLIYASGTASNVPLAANLTSSASGAELALNYADGKLYYKNSSGVVTLLASSAGASGDVVGPASATDNALARFDLTTGKLIQNSVGILSDAGALSGLTDISASGNVTLSGGTANGVAYLNGSKVLTTGSALTFDGTNLGVGGTASSRFSTSTSLIGNNGYANAFRMYDDGSASTSQSSNSYGFGFINNNALSYTAGTSGSHSFYVANSIGMALNSTGLGIGTSSPAYKLDVAGDIALKNNATYLYSKTSGGTVVRMLGINSGNTAYIGPIDSGPGDAILNASSSSTNIQFYASGSEQMRLNSTGLGIGTSSPAAKVDVSQSQNGQTAVQLTNSNAGASAEATFIANNGTYIGSFGVAGASKSAFGAILASDAYVFSNANVANTGITLMANSANGVIKFATGGSAEKMRLDSSGNLGLGVTPSAWGTTKALQFPGGSIGGFTNGTNNNQSIMLANSYFGSGGGVYINSDYATYYRQYSGTHAWFNAPSGTAGNAITFTQAMTLDASGNLGVGITNPTYKLVVSNAGAAGLEVDPSGVNGGPLLQGYNRSGAAYVQLTYDGLQHIWRTSGSERARITSSGNFVAGGSVALATNATDGFLYVPTCAGTPTGTPTAITGMAPIVVNTTNNKLYFYSGGAWRDAGP